ncbi:DNA alkylation repair protein [Corallococcus sp. bb12-1]|uniref:DNA alkylation repair protein n=1 Tax=Corallococcus sp. bb12-1 TaxID=2996784 RepID=UPI00226E39FE|nr:DNA alkylation repair protein [Corallococcus sp. bb12-1]MCY1039903.1 DNA alkylation repair protein [Corallococcus sp. bb12-1]
MTLDETMQELERLGSPQTRKTYLRHGAPEPLSGVNFGPLGVLKKRIGTAPTLARSLWASGHTEARLLATMVVDAPALSWTELGAWAKSLDWHTLTDVFVTNVALRSPHALKALEWTRSSSEWVGRAGWQLLASLLVKTTVLAGEDLAPWVKRIEQELPTAKNRVREAMNSALIALGAQGGALQTAALATAKRLGKVEVDQGDTACETPDAAQYIQKIQARKGDTAAAKSKRGASDKAAPDAPRTAVAKKQARKSPGAVTRESKPKTAATKPAKKSAKKRTASARTRPRA